MPLEEWPEDILAALPRGISRHVVRFVRLSGRVLAVKEIKADIARREYEMLRSLNRLRMPCVEPFAVVSGRIGLDGSRSTPASITRHLQFSLPYRALYSQNLRKGTAVRLIDALAVLLVRLHLAGLLVGRRVAVEHPVPPRRRRRSPPTSSTPRPASCAQRLSDGQREHDLEIARVNIAGELMDLEAGGLLQEDRDPIDISERIVLRYRELWDELTGTELIDDTERWRVDDRIRRLNALGFDVDELEITTDIDGTSIQIQPKVVDAGHHSRRLLRLTGLDVRENQARDCSTTSTRSAAATGRQGEDEEIVAHEWLRRRVYEPVTRRVPRALVAKLEPAEVFHEVLEHRWYLAERAQHDIPIEQAIDDYIASVLPGKPDEQAVLGVDTRELPVIATPPRPSLGSREHRSPDRPQGAAMTDQPTGPAEPTPQRPARAAGRTAPGRAAHRPRPRPARPRAALRAPRRAAPAAAGLRRAPAQPRVRRTPATASPVRRTQPGYPPPRGQPVRRLLPGAGLRRGAAAYPGSIGYVEQNFGKVATLRPARPRLPHRHRHRASSG